MAKRSKGSLLQKAYLEGLLESVQRRNVHADLADLDGRDYDDARVRRNPKWSRKIETRSVDPEASQCKDVSMAWDVHQMQSAVLGVGTVLLVAAGAIFTFGYIQGPKFDDRSPASMYAQGGPSDRGTGRSTLTRFL